MPDRLRQQRDPASGELAFFVIAGLAAATGQRATSVPVLARHDRHWTPGSGLGLDEIAQEGGR